MAKDMVINRMIRQWIFMGVVAAGMLFPSWGSSQERLWLPPSVSQHETMQQLPTQCQNALMKHFGDPAVTILYTTDNNIVINIRLRHHDPDIPHIMMHVLQFYEALQDSGYVMHYYDAHQADVGHIVDQQAIDAARGFRMLYGNVCDGDISDGD